MGQKEMATTAAGKMDHDLRAEGRRIYLVEFRTAAGELAIFALLAPAGTPEPIIAKLHREAVRILTEAAVIQTTGNG